MGFLTSVVSTTTTTTAIAAAATAIFAHSDSPPPSSSNYFISRNLTFPRLSITNSTLTPVLRFGLLKTSSRPPSALHMDAPSSDHQPSFQNNALLPELLTEYMVDMKCDGCVNAVKNKLATVDGVKNVDVDLSNQVVRILGSSPVKTMTKALEQTGRKARLIGQGVPEDFLVSAAVSEFKGPDIFGVVRLAQVNMELARIEANFSGLSPGKHGWSINEFGDLTKGPSSTGKVFNPANKATEKQPLGDLGTLEVDEKGEAFFSGFKEQLRVVDLIGRSIVMYETEDKSDPGLAAAVIARSAGVGENYKKLCTCDGTTIWEATDKDFVTNKV
ncbi:copper chaperone for superoxide dismutase, chloroplastic/cytosolic [Rhododendron vialii]|uniref:copper chaperone for superoxide dismutase, chloroplastic/cytosolic n=1 Tax=Rhododendron vialii TaxID=182163 RepID=UPI00265F4A88|nr:copper chaperone for superoxide dismutase, chloroplastic/cytosolic [Rhododendron vialii]